MITLTEKSKHTLIKVRNLKYSNAFGVELSIAITGQWYGHVGTPDVAVKYGQGWELTGNYH